MMDRRPRAGRRLDWPLVGCLAIAALGLVEATACDGSRASSGGATATAPSTGSTVAVGPSATSSAPSSSAPSNLTSTAAPPSPLRNDLPPDVREAWSDLVGRELPPTFAGPDEQRFYARCLSFTRALHLEAAELGHAGQLEGLEEGDSAGPMRAIDAVRSHPPPDTEAEDVRWCAEYTLGGLRLGLASRVAEEARSTLQALAGAVVATHGRTGKLCPSSAEPVPKEVREVQAKPYAPKAADWDGPAWRCLRFRWLRPMRFQLELRSGAKDFSLIARGSPLGDGTVDEYRLDGKLGPEGIELGEVVGRFLSDE